MNNKLRVAIFGALLLSAFVLSLGAALPVSAATSVTSATSSSTTVSKSLDVHGVALPQPPPRGNDYTRGYRDGYNSAVHDCRIHRFQGRYHRGRESAYDRGFVDGYNYARAHDRTCRRR